MGRHAQWRKSCLGIIDEMRDRCSHSPPTNKQQISSRLQWPCACSLDAFSSILHFGSLCLVYVNCSPVDHILCYWKILHLPGSNKNFEALIDKKDLGCRYLEVPPFFLHAQMHLKHCYKICVENHSDKMFLHIL